jgi:hypothetical protein
MHVERYDSERAAEYISALLDLYAEVYHIPWYIDDSFFSVDMYTKRLDGAIIMSGIEVATSSVDGLLASVGHSATLPPAVRGGKASRTISRAACLSRRTCHTAETGSCVSKVCSIDFWYGRAGGVATR